MQPRYSAKAILLLGVCLLALRLHPLRHARAAERFLGITRPLPAEILVNCHR